MFPSIITVLITIVVSVTLARISRDRLNEIVAEVNHAFSTVLGFLLRERGSVAFVLLLAWVLYDKRRNVSTVVGKLRRRFRKAPLRHLICHATAAGEYDTGLAIINYGLMLRRGSNKAVSTPLTFTFFPQGFGGGVPPRTEFSYTTQVTSPGSGLSVGTGNLLPGGTYTVTLSLLLAAAGVPKPFSGFVVLTSESPGVHCHAVIGNFRTVVFPVEVLSF
jgi:hypothetical protein